MKSKSVKQAFQEKDDQDCDYYERWLLALEKMVLEIARLVSREEVQRIEQRRLASNDALGELDKIPALDQAIPQKLPHCLRDTRFVVRACYPVGYRFHCFRRVPHRNSQT